MPASDEAITFCLSDIPLANSISEFGKDMMTISPQDLNWPYRFNNRIYALQEKTCQIGRFTGLPDD
ncbi:MAG: hypothetical protein AAF151_12855 [Cyanobacteria bacterium J06656_5]